MRTIQVVEEDGYFMAFASDDGKNACIGEGLNREQAIKDAHELADMLITAQQLIRFIIMYAVNDGVHGDRFNAIIIILSPTVGCPYG